MTQNTYDNFGIVYEVLQFTLLFLGGVSLRRVNAIFHIVALSLHRQLVEAMLKVADLRWAKGIIGGRDGDSLCPVVFFWVAVVLLQPVQNAIPVLSDAGLPYVDNGFVVFLVLTKKEVHTCLLQFLSIFAQVQCRTRDLKSKSRPVCQCTLHAAIDTSIHQI